MRKSKEQAAFTLIELLIASLLLALLATLSFGSLNQAISHEEGFSTRVDTQLDQITASRIFAMDLALWLNQPFRVNGESQNGLSLAADHLRFTSLTDQGPMRIEYLFAEGQLIRRIWPNFYPQPTQSPEDTVLLKDLKRLSLSVTADGQTTRLYESDGQVHQRRVSLELTDSQDRSQIWSRNLP
jgi:prepilin-type N-terminal cleavage/methylation domain-containing protein